MKAKTQRKWLVGIVVLCLAGAAAIVLTVFNDSMMYFYSPTQVVEENPEPGTKMRVGGLVVAGSLVSEGNTHRFRITDNSAEMAITYEGLLPNLFREGQGVVAEGTLKSVDAFSAKSLLAKHDENYMPPEVAQSLKDAHERGVAGQAPRIIESDK